MAIPLDVNLLNKYLFINLKIPAEKQMKHWQCFVVSALGNDSKETRRKKMLCDFLEAVVRRCCSEWVFLKISQISLESICVGVSLSTLLKGDPNSGVLRWNLPNIFGHLFLQSTSSGCFWLSQYFLFLASHYTLKFIYYFFITSKLCHVRTCHVFTGVLGFVPYLATCFNFLFVKYW